MKLNGAGGSRSLAEQRFRGPEFAARQLAVEALK